MVYEVEANHSALPDSPHKKAKIISTKCWKGCTGLIADSNSGMRISAKTQFLIYLQQYALGMLPFLNFLSSCQLKELVFL